jgi:hypothetical protein
MRLVEHILKVAAFEVGIAFRTRVLAAKSAQILKDTKRYQHFHFRLILKAF